MTMPGTAKEYGPSRQLRAVIWDMDGTLIDSADVVPDAFIATVQARCGISYTREQIIDAYPLGPPPIMLAHLLHRPATTADLDEYHTRLQTMAHQAPDYGCCYRRRCTGSPQVINTSEQEHAECSSRKRVNVRSGERGQ